MSTVSRRRRAGTTAAQVGVMITGAIMMVGALLPPWPTLSWQFMGRTSLIEHAVEVLLDYPVREFPGILIWVDKPLSMWLITMAPVVLQALIIAVMTYAVARILAGIAGGAAFAAPVQRHLSLLAVVALGGAVLQFVVGLISWNVGGQWFVAGQPGPAMPIVEAQAAHVPFPSWPITLIVIGLLAMAVRMAFRRGAMFEEEAEGVI